MFNNGYYPTGGYSSFRPVATSLTKRFNWNGILNNTQRTLNIINQAIPVINQVKPIYNNARTAFKILGALNTTNQSTNNTQKTTTENINSSNSGPNFFL